MEKKIEDISQELRTEFNKVVDEKISVLKQEVNTSVHHMDNSFQFWKTNFFIKFPYTEGHYYMKQLRQLNNIQIYVLFQNRQHVTLDCVVPDPTNRQLLLCLRDFLELQFSKYGVRKCRGQSMITSLFSWNYKHPDGFTNET